MSEADDRFYANLERKQAKARARVARMAEQHPQRMVILKQMKSGEITLEEAQAACRRL